MSLPKYGKYKDSGIPWLGSVPAHWDVVRLKYVCEVFPSNVDKHSRDGEPSVLLCNYTDVYYNEKITREMQFMAATASPDQIARFALRAGDTIITKDSETADDIAIAAYVPHDLPGVVCGYHLSMIRPRETTAGPFVKRLFDSTYAKARFAVAANGLTRVGLGQYALDNVEVPFPPLAEQTAIAVFLDRETAKIDALIAEQEKLITLLAEKRQAIISHAVTRGLNPDVPMKDSGVAWLGKVPAHWDVCRVKDVARLESGHTPSKQFPQYWEDCNIPWVSLNDSKHLASHDYISETAVKINELGLANSSARMLPAGAVVFTRDATIGLSCITTVPMAVSQHLIAWCPSPRISSLFLLRIFNAMKPHLDSYTFGATIKTIGMGDLKKLVTTVPPTQEQAEIVRFIDMETAKLDALTSEADRAIALLKERRSALITAAVTGQIDVRGVMTQPIPIRLEEATTA
jgi:type I restriction enzyme S subunit